MRPAPPDPQILELGDPTDLQRERIEAYIKHGTAQKAADSLRLKDRALIIRAKTAVEKRAARNGWTRLDNLSGHVPEGFHVKGKSILLDEDGMVKQQWLKTDASKEEQEQALNKFIEGLCSHIKPVKPKAAPKKVMDDSLMSGIFIGDAHIGMYAYSPETKHSDFDSDIASRGLREAIDDLISRSPNAEIGLLVDVGDFMHANTSHNKTFAGTDVDVDTRYDRVLEIAGQVMQYAIAQMLKKFKRVIVVIAKGNHNPDAAVAVQQITKAYFHKEPRVDVLRTSGFFHYLEWGKWLIGVNHGDKVKAPKLVQIMARDMPEAWGRTTHRIWATGHFHHEQVLELDGCTVHKFGALPPPDSWHASMGFGGDGQMQMITFKKDGGKHSTLIYDLVRPAIKADITI